MSDYDDDFMADDEDYDLEYSEDSNSGQSINHFHFLTLVIFYSQFFHKSPGSHVLPKFVFSAR